jgi:hypothetical protein
MIRKHAKSPPTAGMPNSCKSPKDPHLFGISAGSRSGGGWDRDNLGAKDGSGSYMRRNQSVVMTARSSARTRDHPSFHHYQ